MKKRLLIKIRGPLIAQNIDEFLYKLPDVSRYDQVLLDGSCMKHIDGSGMLAIALLFGQLGDKMGVCNFAEQPMDLFLSFDIPMKDLSQVWYYNPPDQFLFPDEACFA